MLDKTSSIICAFGLASAAPRSPYRHLELCGIALTFIFALKILPRRYPSVAFEEQDERRRRGKTGTFGHIFDQFPLGDQFLRVLQFGLVDLVGKLFAGIDAVKAGQIRRVEAGHAGKGSQGKVIVFHVVLNITVDPLDDGLGAVGFVFLALAAGFGAQVGKAVQHFQLGSGTAAQVGAMSCAFVQGLQGDDLSTGVAATAKHFLGYSQTVGGLNLTRTQADARELREVFAKPFEAAIRKAGIRTVMNSYSEWEGRPVCASRKLLTDLLRSELSFDGLVVSDYRSVQRLLDDILATADDITDAALQCLTAGLDMELPDRLGYADGMTHAFAEGKVDISYLDRAVLRVLTLKFELGLFDEPYPQWQQYHAAAFAPTAAAEQRATRESIVLTKNEGNTLPLTDRSIKLAVIGPGASSLRLLYGGYTQPSMLEMFQVVQDSSAMAGVGDKSTAKPVRKYDLAATDREIHKSRPEAKTIFEALQELYPNCTYTQGCDYLDPTQTDFAAALAAAESADAVILCLSGKNGWGRHCDTGEGNDAASLDLPGAQEELARVVLAANPRTIVTHTDGRPLTSPHIYANAAAILEAFTPGTWGGTELAALIAGIHSPAGCLPLPLPRTAGHEPMFMAEHRGTTGQSFVAGSLNPDGYWQSDFRPLRPFGYGLSYTTFTYEALNLIVDPDGTAEALVTVHNTGSCDGETVVQLYGRDAIATIVRPELELLGFARITVPQGQRRTVRFRFNLNQMAFPDEYSVWHLEAGRFTISAGPNSADLPLTADYIQPCTREILPEAREYFAEWDVVEE